MYTITLDRRGAPLCHAIASQNTLKRRHLPIVYAHSYLFARDHAFSPTAAALYSFCARSCSIICRLQ